MLDNKHISIFNTIRILKSDGDSYDELNNTIDTSKEMGEANIDFATKSVKNNLD